jgi:hypothetical protein
MAVNMRATGLRVFCATFGIVLCGVAPMCAQLTEPDRSTLQQRLEAAAKRP